MSQFKKIAGYTAVIGLVTLILKPLGIVKDMMTASYFGLTAELGLYFLLIGISTYISSAIFAMYRGSVTPIYLSLKNNGEVNRANSLISTTWIIYLLLLSLLCIAIYVMSEGVLNFFALGLDSQGLSKANEGMPLISILIFMQGLNSIIKSILEAEKRFVIVKMISGVVPIISMLSIFYFNRLGWFCLLYGLVFGYLAAFILLSFVCYWVPNTKYRKPDFKEEHLRPLLKRWVPLAIGAAVTSIAPVIDRMMITLLGDTELAVYGYANTLISNLNLILITSLNTAILPVFSAISKENKSELSKTFCDTLCHMVAYLVPIAIFLSMFSENIIHVLYERGNFSSDSTVEVAIVLEVFSFSIIPLAGVMICARLFNVLLDVKTTFIAAIISAILNYTLNLLFMYEMGVAGIALSTVLTHCVIIFYMLSMLAIHHKIGFIRNLIYRVILIAIHASVLSCVIYYVLQFSSLGAMTVFVPMVFSLGLLMNVKEYKVLGSLIIIKKRKSV